MEINEKDPLKKIELIGRTCYKSEDRITDDSCVKFVSNLVSRKHLAILEHYVFVYELNNECESKLSLFDYFDSQRFVNATFHKVGGSYRYVISFNARSLIDILEDCAKRDTIEAKYQAQVVENLIEKVIYDYNCQNMFGNHFSGINHEEYIKIDDITSLSDKERLIHEYRTFKFVTDRGVSHELVRHRVASFAQESTRYANYSKDKFGSEITVIEPYNWDTMDDVSKELMSGSWKNAEYTYMELLKNGLQPQQARAVLPNELKTEIVVTASIGEWNHMGDLRLRGTTGSPHPDMKLLMERLKEIFPEL